MQPDYWHQLNGTITGIEDSRLRGELQYLAGKAIEQATERGREGKRYEHGEVRNEFVLVIPPWLALKQWLKRQPIKTKITIWWDRKLYKVEN